MCLARMATCMHMNNKPENLKINDSDRTLLLRAIDLITQGDREMADQYRDVRIKVVSL